MARNLPLLAALTHKAVRKRRESNHSEGGNLDADQNPATDVNLTTGSTTTDDSSANERSNDAAHALTTTQGQWYVLDGGIYYWQGPGEAGVNHGMLNTTVTLQIW